MTIERVLKRLIERMEEFHHMCIWSMLIGSTDKDAGELHEYYFDGAVLVNELRRK